MNYNKLVFVLISLLMLAVLVSCDVVTNDSDSKENYSEELLTNETVADSNLDKGDKETTGENTTENSASDKIIVSADNVSSLYFGIGIKNAAKIMGFSGYEYRSSLYPIVRTWHLDDGSDLELVFTLEGIKDHNDLTDKNIGLIEFYQNSKCTYAYITKNNETTVLFGSY